MLQGQNIGLLIVKIRNLGPYLTQAKLKDFWGNFPNIYFELLIFISPYTMNTMQSDSSVEGSNSSPLLFEMLPKVNQEGSQWTDCEVRDAINLIYQNLLKLDSYLSDLVSVPVVFLFFVLLNRQLSQKFKPMVSIII